MASINSQERKRRSEIIGKIIAQYDKDASVIEKRFNKTVRGTNWLQ